MKKKSSWEHPTNSILPNKKLNKTLTNICSMCHEFGTMST